MGVCEVNVEVCEVNEGVYKVNVGNTKLIWPSISVELIDLFHLSQRDRSISM